MRLYLTRMLLLQRDTHPCKGAQSSAGAVDWQLVNMIVVMMADRWLV